LSVAPGVNGEIQHVVRLTIRKPKLENIHMPVDGVDQPNLMCHPQQQRHAAATDSPRPFRQVISSRRRRDHRFAVRPRLELAALTTTADVLFDSTLVLPKLLAYPVLHLKSSVSFR